nr:unnamed protein product [Callosobruchus chinensis]
MSEEISILHEAFTGHMSIIWAIILGATCNQIFGVRSTLTNYNSIIGGLVTNRQGMYIFM